MDYSEIIDCLLLQVPTAGFSLRLLSLWRHSAQLLEERVAECRTRSVLGTAGGVSPHLLNIHLSFSRWLTVSSVSAGRSTGTSNSHVPPTSPPPPLPPPPHTHTPHTLSLVPYETCQNKPAHANQQESAVGPGNNFKQISRWSQPLNWKTSLCSQRR